MPDDTSHQPRPAPRSRRRKRRDMAEDRGFIGTLFFDGPVEAVLYVLSTRRRNARTRKVLAASRRRQAERLSDGR